MERFCLQVSKIKGQLGIHRRNTELSGVGSSIPFRLLWANFHPAEAFVCILRCVVAQELSQAPKLLRKELLMLVDSLMLPTLWEHFRDGPFLFQHQQQGTKQGP